MMDDSISRRMAIDALQKEINKGIPPFNDVFGSIRCGVRLARNIIEDLPSAQPEIVRCKECKYWKDSDGVYRRGFDAESKCPLNLKKVYEGTFYCGMAERRTDENNNE